MIRILFKGLLPPFFTMKRFFFFVCCLFRLVNIGRVKFFFSEDEFEYLWVALCRVVKLVIPVVSLLDDGNLQPVLINENGLLVDGWSSWMNDFFGIFLFHVLLAGRTIRVIHGLFFKLPFPLASYRVPQLLPPSSPRHRQQILVMLFQETVKGFAFANCLLLDLGAFGEGGGVLEGLERRGGNKLEHLVGYLAGKLRNEIEDFHDLVRYRETV